VSETILTSRKLRIPGLKHGFTTRALGNVKENLGLWEKHTGLKERALVRLNQVHGKDVLLADRPAAHMVAAKDLHYDASITNRNDIILSVRTADCTPVLFYCPDPVAIAVVHAGWKGTLAGTVTCAVSELQEHFGCAPENLIAAIGPCIHPCCYRVGEDVYRPFLQRFGSEAVSVLGGEQYVHLAAANRTWLIECGLSAENIDLVDYCTSCRDDLFFSHRRDGSDTGRQMAFIVLTEAGQ
jgi:YfiH family protein